MSEIIFYDGVCGLCNRFVQFIIKRDRNNCFLFAPLQGLTAEKNLGDKCTADLLTIVFQTEGQTFTESDAALQILRRLPGAWSLVAALLLVPRIIRNFIYQIVAKNRYQWFGKFASCPIPEKENSKRFLP